MAAITSRLAKLEGRMGTGGDAPSPAELAWARDIHRQYGPLMLREMLVKFNWDNGRQIELNYTDEERAFLAECDAGMLAKADAIIERDEKARGVWKTPEEQERDRQAEIDRIRGYAEEYRARPTVETSLN